VVHVGGTAGAPRVLQPAHVLIPFQHDEPHLPPRPGVHGRGWPVLLWWSSSSHGSMVDPELHQCHYAASTAPPPRTHPCLVSTLRAPRVAPHPPTPPGRHSARSSPCHSASDIDIMEDGQRTGAGLGPVDRLPRRLCLLRRGHRHGMERRRPAAPTAPLRGPRLRPLLTPDSCSSEVGRQRAGNPGGPTPRERNGIHPSSDLPPPATPYSRPPGSATPGRGRTPMRKLGVHRPTFRLASGQGSARLGSEVPSSHCGICGRPAGSPNFGQIPVDPDPSAGQLPPSVTPPYRCPPRPTV
jgi:hypothetical protein